MSDFINQLINYKIAGIAFGAIFGFNLWIFRVIMAYLRETRENYVSRLNDAVLELEQQKTENIRLELRIQTLNFLHSLRDKS